MRQSDPRPAVSDRVFRALSDDVLSGRYEPGEKLPTQRELAAELGVNMASVREALKRLEQLRLVESRQGDAMRVTDWRAHGGLDVIALVLVRSGALDRDALRSIMEARASMLSEAGRLAAARRTDEQTVRLREIAATIAEAESREAAQALDFAFFSELVDASGNLVFALVMNSIREVYFEHADLFRDIVDSPRSLVPGYAEIAEAIARELRGAGHAVDVRDADDAPPAEGYDAVVIGSAVYMGTWLPAARQFVERNQATLATLPVWLFSSGPLGQDQPHPPGDPARLAELMAATGARGHRIFVGKLDTSQLSFGERLVVKMVKAPVGDFRDWEVIRAWARQIAGALPAPAVGI